MSDPSAHWRDMLPTQQAEFLCNDADFRRYVGNTVKGHQRLRGTLNPTQQDAIAFVRGYCGVVHLSDLDRNRDARRNWDALMMYYLAEQPRPHDPSPSYTEAGKMIADGRSPLQLGVPPLEDDDGIHRS